MPATRNLLRILRTGACIKVFSSIEDGDFDVSTKFLYCYNVQPQRCHLM